MFDIKLTDGRYFKNIDIYDISFERFDEHINEILDNADYKMEIYHGNDTELEDLLAEIVSDDIEYICKAYTYKEMKNNE